MAVLECPKRCTPSFFDKTDFRTDHTVLEEVSGRWRARCDSCGSEYLHDIPADNNSRAALDKYPRLNPQLGVMVNSKSDLMEKAAKKGYRRVD